MTVPALSPRINIVTLGVADIARALAFYERCGYAYAGASTYRYRDDVHATRVYAKRLPVEKP